MQIKKDERNEIKSTSHSRYRCQYHIVFAPKYRRKEIYGQLKKDIGEMLRTLRKQRNVEILEAEACVDHIHTRRKKLRKISATMYPAFQHWRTFLPSGRKKPRLITAGR